MIKDEKIATRIFIILFVASIGTILVWAAATIKDEITNVNNRPEQSEQVEVVGKRIHITGHERAPKYRDYYVFIVAFEFPDGSVKELQVEDDLKKESYSSLYESIDEGDTGVLTYKEIENVEKKYQNEDIRYYGRLLISFEKDPKYGGSN